MQRPRIKLFTVQMVCTPAPQQRQFILNPIQGPLPNRSPDILRGFTPNFSTLLRLWVSLGTKTMSACVTRSSICANIPPE